MLTRGALSRLQARRRSRRREPGDTDWTDVAAAATWLAELPWLLLVVVGVVLAVLLLGLVAVVLDVVLLAVAGDHQLSCFQRFQLAQSLRSRG